MPPKRRQRECIEYCVCTAASISPTSTCTPGQKLASELYTIQETAPECMFTSRYHTPRRMYFMMPV